MNFSNYTFKWFPIPYPCLEFNFYFEDKKYVIGVFINTDKHVFVSPTRDKLPGINEFEDLLKKKEISYEKI